MASTYICEMAGGIHEGSCPTCGCQVIKPLIDKIHTYPEQDDDTLAELAIGLLESYNHDREILCRILELLSIKENEARLAVRS